MQFVDGEGFSDAEYALALSDKKLIYDIKKRCDLSTKEGIKKAYNEVSSCQFKTRLGDKFDDYVFGLYEGLKNDTLESANLKSGDYKTSTKNKSKRKKDVSELKDIDPELHKAAIKHLKRQNAVRSITIVALLVVAGFSIGYFVKYYSSAFKLQKDSEKYIELKDDKFAEVLQNVTPVIRKEYKEEVVIPDILDEYLALYNKNKSLIGWIKIADTIIDYPVMQTKDNEYYLKHNFNEESDANGAIFLDTNCDVILGNDNWIVYGHHMKNGKMFSSLNKYANKDFYEEHKTFTFDTIYEKGTYEVMYVFRSHIYEASEVTFKYYQFIDANSEVEFNSNMEEMSKMSLIDTGVTATYGDQLLTLSTCDYQETNGRFVVVAKKIK